MAIPTTQLFSRQEALLASTVPMSIDSVAVGAAAAAVYTVPTGTGLIYISTDVKCTFREVSEVAATLPGAGDTDGEESAWLHPGQDRAFRVSPGTEIGFHGDGVSAARVTIERYVGTNSQLPPD